VNSPMHLRWRLHGFLVGCASAVGEQGCVPSAGGCPGHLLIRRRRPTAYCCLPSLLGSCLVSPRERPCRGWESKHSPITCLGDPE